MSYENMTREQLVELLRHTSEKCERLESALSEEKKRSAGNNARLNERIKEQQCLYGIMELGRGELHLDDILDQALKLIPKGWQYPESTQAWISYDGKVHQTPGFEKTDWTMKSDILVNDSPRGAIEVAYLHEHPSEYEGPFLLEERSLIDSIANLLGDIISRRLAGSELEESELRFRRLAENAQDMIYRMSLPQGIYEYVSPACEKVMGRTQQEFYDNPLLIQEIIDPEFINYFKEKWEDLKKGEVDPKYEYRIITASGEPRWLSQTNYMVMGKDGSPEALEGIVTDVTAIKNAEESLRRANEALEERIGEATRKYREANQKLQNKINEKKQAEERLRRNEEMFRSIFDSIDEVIYVADPETYELLYMNKQAEDAFGDWRGKKCHKVLQNLDLPCPFCTNDKILGQSKGKSYIWEWQNKVTRTWFKCIDKAITWPDGRIVRYEMAIDITSSKLAEQQLREQAQAILDLSTPVIQVWEGIVAAPLIGTLDEQRALQFMERFLSAIVETSSPIAILDITGVPEVDTHSAQHIIDAVSGARLLGADVILTGVSPAIAQTLVHLGIGLHDIKTCSNFAAGLRLAISTQTQQGLKNPAKGGAA